MKKLVYIFSLLSIVILAGCSDDMEYIFDKSPDARAAEFNAQNKALLVNQENGWKGYYSSIGEIGGFKLVMKFSDDGKVRIKSERIKISGERIIERATQLKEAKYGTVTLINIPAKDETVGYGIVTSQTSKLVFKSHCVLNDWHSAKNINEVYVRDTVRYPILGGEFQFTVKSATPEKVVLQSLTDKDEKTLMILTPAKLSDWNNLDYTKMTEVKTALVEKENPEKFFRNLVVGTSRSSSSMNRAEANVQLNGQIKVDAEARVLRYSYLKDDKIENTFNRFAITETGIVMLDTIKLPNGKQLVNFTYDKEEKAFISEDAGLNSRIEYSNAPGIIYFPFVDKWGFKDGDKVDSALQYSTMNMFRGGSVSEEFYDLCSTLRQADGLKTFDFYINNEKNPSGCSETITLTYNKVINLQSNLIHIDIPVEIERVSNERIIFRTKEDYKKSYKSTIPNVDMLEPDAAKDLMDVLTDEQGFYLIPNVFLFPETNEPYQVAIFISVAHPEYRFVTEYFEFIKKEK